jgi:DNA repair protein RecO
MQVIEDKGIVLKKTIYQDTKLIVSLFTYHHGLINADVTIGKKQLFKFGCLEIGNVVRLDLIKLKNSFKLKDVSLETFPKTLRDHLMNMKVMLSVCQKLSFILPEGLTHPLFFTFMTNALKAFDQVPCKETWASFIFLKWLQAEGLMHVSIYPKSIQNELKELLLLKKFEDLKNISQETLMFIESQLSLCT